MKRMLREGVAMLAVLGLGLPTAALAAKKAKESGTGSTSSAKAPDKKLSEGLEKLHAANQAEIEGGKLAQQSAVSPDVKSFAEKMVTDHTKNDKQLASIAESMGVSLEGKQFAEDKKDAQKKSESWAKKTGADFDQAYAKDMVKDHQKDAKEVRNLAEQARKDGQSEVASFLDQTEQAMQTHLSLAKRLEKSVKNEKNTASRKHEASTGTGTSVAPPPSPK